MLLWRLAHFFPVVFNGYSRFFLQGGRGVAALERLAQARAWAEKIAALFRADEPWPGTAANGLGLNEAKGKYAMLPGSASKI
jgi:hypothetical protein